MGPLDGLIGYQLRRAFLRSNQLFGAMAGKAGFAPGQFGVLKLVALNPGRSQSEVAAAAGLDRSSLTQMLDQLEGKGWVERRPGRDRRSVSLYVTKEGAAACEAAEPQVARHEALIRAGLTDAEARTLAGLLRRLGG
jgi:DNA-binding MarR family transcriptional regulator